MKLSRLKALMILSECTGDDIWSVQHCTLRGVPSDWIEELSDCFESGFESDSQTIYIGDRITNQYQGLRDVDLAQKVGQLLGIDVEALIARSATRRHLVQLIKDTAEEE